MTKLLDILLEVLRESKPIKFSEEEILDMEDIYDNFESKVKNFGQGNLKDFIGHIKTTNKTPYLGRILLKGSPKYGSDNFNYAIEVILYYNVEKNKAASYVPNKKRILINVNSDLLRTKKSFINMLQHELIHAKDPKVTNTSLSNKVDDQIDKKEKKDTSNPFFKYLKRPQEFDAFSSSFVNSIEDSLVKLKEDDKKKLKSSLRNLVNYLLGELKKYPNSNLKYKDFGVIANDAVSKLSKDLNIIDDLGFDGDDDIGTTFFHNMVLYLNKPSLFKKYVQRVATLL